MTTPRANYITYPHFYAFIYCSFAVNIQKWLEMIRHTDVLTLHITDPLDIFWFAIWTGIQHIQQPVRKQYCHDSGLKDHWICLGLVNLCYYVKTSTFTMQSEPNMTSLPVWKKKIAALDGSRMELNRESLLDAYATWAGWRTWILQMRRGQCRVFWSI